MKANVRKAVLHKRNELMSKKNVVAVMSGQEEKDGVKTGRDAVVVLVEKKVPVYELNSKDLIPRKLVDDGVEVPTDVVQVGVIKALHQSRHRPALPGTSIGHFAITAGTLGVVVKKEGEDLILSNNHVLANENNALIGDAIFQPGPHDGGTEDDKIAELAYFVPIDFNERNTVDAALARFVNVAPPVEPPVEEPPVEQPPVEEPELPKESEDFFDKFLGFFETLFKKLLELFGIRDDQDEEAQMQSFAVAGVDYVNDPINLGVAITKQIAEVEVGDTVQKSGRTTGVTVDKVIGVDAAANVQYDGGVARFDNQIVCGPMSAGGDSGSVVYDADGNAIGLLFAGSETVTIVNRIQDVFDALEIDGIA